MRPQLDNLIRNESPIYVRNQTNPRGQIVITFFDPATGKVIPVHIPRTTIPWCVTDFVPRSVINASSDFRRFIAKGIVELLDPSTAEEELQAEDAQEELAELRGSAHGLSPYSNLAKQEPQKKETKVEFKGLVEDQSSTANSINNQVMAIIVGVSAGDMGVRQAMRDLRSIADQLTEEDFSYIIAESKRGGKIHEFASKKLAELKTAYVAGKPDRRRTPKTVHMADEGISDNDKASGKN